MDEEFSERFQREARAISSLNHPTVCTLYDVGSNYLVMELIEGGTLADRLKAGPVPVDRAVEYGVQIARALTAAHAKGVMAVPVSTTASFDPGVAKVLFDRTPARIIDFDVAADGQSFFINSEVSGPETKPMNIVVNWMAALKSNSSK